MKMLTLALMLALLAPFAQGAEPPAAATSGASIALPAPKTDGTFAVEKALHERRSLRAPAETPLTLEEIGQLCWAAQGVTDEKGHRTAPSAMASYPLELYVLAASVTGLAPGCYLYDRAQHALTPRAGVGLSDFDQKAVGQGWTGKVPAMFVIAGSPGPHTLVLLPRSESPRPPLPQSRSVEQARPSI